jgi:hypothetical protein
MIHVEPSNDLRQHVWNGDPCPCMPREVDGVVIHNSYDGREVGEVIMRLIGVFADVVGNDHEWTNTQRQAVEHAESIVALHWPNALDR